MQKLFGEINEAGQSNLCAQWLKETTKALMVNDITRPKNKLQVTKYRKRVQMSSEWLDAMEEELQQIEKNNTWELVPRPVDKNVIGTKWVYQNKMNEEGKIVRHKARLMCKGYSQVKGINLEEIFAPMARLEAIRMFLAFSTYKGYKFYQMDIKSSFLNGNLEDKLYMEQPKGFLLHDNETFVCQLKKLLEHGTLD